MRTEIFDDFIPYWDDSTESVYDYQETETETTTETNFDLPF